MKRIQHYSKMLQGSEISSLVERQIFLDFLGEKITYEKIH